MLSVIVAGGAGFIGSHLCRRLLDQGRHVVCVDNLVTGRDRNIADLLDRPEFTFVKHDIIDGLPPLPVAADVFHLASPASPPGYQQHPIETLRVNADGSFHLLCFAQRMGARYLYCSTSEAYGDPLEHPQREEYRGNVSSIGPRSMYDEGKRYGEALTMAFVRSRGVDARIVRIFNTYGPASDPHDGRLVPNLITQALGRLPMTIYGDGTQTRSLCYVSDLVDGLVAAMECDAARGEVINLGNPDEHTVLEFAETIRALTASDSPFVYREPAVGDDPQRRQPDIAKAACLLGWRPTVQLTDGLSRTIEWFRSELAAEVAATGQASALETAR